MDAPSSVGISTIVPKINETRTNDQTLNSLAKPDPSQETSITIALSWLDQPTNARKGDKKRMRLEVQAAGPNSLRENERQERGRGQCGTRTKTQRPKGRWSMHKDGTQPDGICWLSLYQTGIVVAFFSSIPTHQANCGDAVSGKSDGQWWGCRDVSDWKKQAQKIACVGWVGPILSLLQTPVAEGRGFVFSLSLMVTA